MSKAQYSTLIIDLSAQNAASRDTTVLEEHLVPLVALPFLRCNTTGQLYEEHCLDMRYLSVLSRDRNLVAPGAVTIATPIDPLFLAHPLLERARSAFLTESSAGEGRFCSLEQIFDPESFRKNANGEDQAMENGAVDDARDLAALNSSTASSLSLVCDVRDVLDEQYYRLNDDKWLAWLCCKVDQTMEALTEHGGGTSTMSDQERERLAIGIVSDYLTESSITKLHAHYSVSRNETEGRGAMLQTHDAVEMHYEATNGGSAKRQKLDPKEIARERARQKTAEKKQEEIEKVARSSKSITSFFAVKKT